jgi:TolB-like protein
VGINIGDVIVEPHDIFGDGVNIAARLEGIAEPGGICISASAYEQVIGKVVIEFADLGEQSLKNIARPVRAYALVRQRGVAKSNNSILVPVSPPHLSIVVLPFANIGGDPDQDYFVDGVTESLTTDLSRIAGSFVIGRNTAFTFKGKAHDVKQVGRELNVRYVLEGSVQGSGNRLRINVQLVDAKTGTHLWAERFDKPIADLFDVQDEIVSRLANTLNAELIEAEARRSERSLHPNSMDLYFQGRASWNKAVTPETMARARGFFERALALDPGNIEAMVGLGSIDLIVATGYMTDNGAPYLASTETTVVKALSYEPNHAFAHLVLGFVQISTNRAVQGMAECARALALDRNLAEAHAIIGVAKITMGRAEETEAHIKEALRLSPRDIFSFQWLMLAGFAKLHLTADADAVGWFSRSVEANRNHPLTHFGNAAALALLGSLDEARTAAKAGLALDPSFTIRRFRDGTPSNNPTFLAKRERVYQGMRMAGVPEG